MSVNNLLSFPTTLRRLSDSAGRVAPPPLRLFAILLELPDEDQLVKIYQYDVKGEDHLRYTHYAARSADDKKMIR
ncbi:hypothetical protein N7523_002786 [Penicillium sp. IBT 18751x]|nr:hypothetical protein N7523_002786 [Penicillium sp. IBT 18751x]